MTLKIALLALIVSAGLYGAIAYWKSREITTVRKFFHIDIMRDGALSIVAGNLTLGTGLFYAASLAHSQALFALLGPIGVFVGYKILGKIAAKLAIEVEGKSHNILDSIRVGTGGLLFYKFLSLIIVFTFLVVTPFEIYVSSSLFASVLPAGQVDDMSIVFAVVLFLVVVTYSATGGLRGIVATDLIQLFFIAIMLLIVFVGSYSVSDSHKSMDDIGLLPSGSPFSVLVLAAASFVTAVATQMFNIINLTIGTSFNSENQQKLYSFAGKVLFGALFLFVLTGLATRGLGTSNLAGIDLLMKILAGNGEAFSIIVFLIVFGMVAVLISTADSGIMAISHVTYENIFGNDSYSDEGGAKLLIVRIVFVLLLNTALAIPMIFLFKYKPNLVSYLLASISALTVAAPFLVSSAINIAKNKQCLASDWRVAAGIMVLTSSVWIIAIWRAFAGDSNTGNYLILGGVLIGFIYYKIDSARSVIKKA